MDIRPYIESDLEELARIYRDAARVTGRHAYTREQVEVWASFADDLSGLAQRLSQGYTRVAVVAGAPAGFGQLHPDDHIALLFTAPDHGRKGLATAIYGQLEKLARSAGVSTLHTEASHIAMPLFSKLGFIVIEKEISEFKGMCFERFRMTKDL